MQELSYGAQKKLKEEQVRAKLKRLGWLDDPKVNEIIGADTLKYYRNKAVFAVGPHGEVGFLKGKTHFVIDIDDCMLQSDAAMVCADALRFPETNRRERNNTAYGQNRTRNGRSHGGARSRQKRDTSDGKTR